MTTAAQDFNTLTEHIEGLDPSQIAPEIGDIVARGDTKSPLTQVIIKYGGELGTDSPVLELLGAVETAIGRAPSSTIKTALGEKAVSATTTALTRTNLHPWIPGSSERLAERGARFASFIDDPHERALRLVKIAQNVIHPARVGVADVGELQISSLFGAASGYFNQAAETTEQITSPERRSVDLSWIAANAANNVGVAGGGRMAGPSPEARAAIFNQPAELFNKAREAADDIESEPARIRTRIRNTIDIFIATADAARATSASTTPELGTMATAEADAVLKAYESGDIDGITPEEACYQLTDFGNRLAQVASEKYVDAWARTVPIREQLTERIVRAFSLARDQARAVRKPLLGSTARKATRLGNVPSNNAALSARSLMKSDPDAAKRVLEIGFDIGLAEDTDRVSSHADSRNAVLGAIGDLARDSANPQLRFELFTLAHRLEREQLDEDTASHTLQVNARQWLQTVRGYDKIALDDSGDGEAFAEFAIRITGENDYWLGSLTDLKNAFESYPHLQQQAVDQIERMSQQQRQTREPKTRSARIAQELIRRV